LTGEKEALATCCNMDVAIIGVSGGIEGASLGYERLKLGAVPYGIQKQK